MTRVLPPDRTANPSGPAERRSAAPARRPEPGAPGPEAGEQSLGRLLAILRGRLRLLVVLAVPVLLAGGWYAGSLPPAYTSEVVLTLTPQPAASADNSFLRLIPRYLRTATAPQTLREAEQVAGLPVGDLDGSVTAENATDTLELSVGVTATDADAAEAAANGLTDVLLDVARSDPLVAAEVVVGPTGAADATRLRQAVVIAVTLVLAVVPGVALALTVEGARPRVRVREDVLRLGLPLLLTARRRTLRRRARPARSRRRPGGDALSSLRAHAGAAAARQPEDGLPITSARRADAVAVRALSGALLGGADGPEGGEAEVRGDAGPALPALPGLLTDPAAQHVVAGTDRCLLVVTAGTPVDEVDDCLRLLTRLGCRPIGAVFVR